MSPGERHRDGAQQDAPIEHTTVTNSTGLYAFPALPSGRYEVPSEHTGFRPFLQFACHVVRRRPYVWIFGSR
jgi:hypothetical protein